MMKLTRSLRLGLVAAFVLLLVWGHGGSERETLVPQVPDPPVEVRAARSLASGNAAAPRLQLPVVFHLHRSQRWQSPESLRGILAEVQRIFDPAGIELQPRFARSEAATTDIDIYLVPEVRLGQRAINGVSFSRGAREIFVRDDVTLAKVADGRPRQPLPLPKYWQAKGDRGKVRVGAQQAEQARTIAHELGHQLGLFHRPEREYLEASGTTGWQLDDWEIAILRQTAIARFGARAIS